MIAFAKRFLSEEALFQRVVRGTLLGGAAIGMQAMTMVGGLNWKNFAIAGAAMLAGMVAAPTKPV